MNKASEKTQSIVSNMDSIELGKLLVARIEAYREKLFDDDKVSPTKFSHYQVALYGCKMIVRDIFKIPHEVEDAWCK